MVKTIVPKGADTVNYGDRYAVIEKSDAVISATLSPITQSVMSR